MEEEIAYIEDLYSDQIALEDYLKDISFLSRLKSSIEKYSDPYIPDTTKSLLNIAISNLSLPKNIYSVSLESEEILTKSVAIETIGDIFKSILNFIIEIFNKLARFIRSFFSSSKKDTDKINMNIKAIEKEIDELKKNVSFIENVNETPIDITDPKSNAHPNKNKITLTRETIKEAFSLQNVYEITDNDLIERTQLILRNIERHNGLLVELNKYFDGIKKSFEVYEVDNELGVSEHDNYVLDRIKSIKDLKVNIIDRYISDNYEKVKEVRYQTYQAFINKNAEIDRSELDLSNSFVSYGYLNNEVHLFLYPNEKDIPLDSEMVPPILRTITSEKSNKLSTLRYVSFSNLDRLNSLLSKLTEHLDRIEDESKKMETYYIKDIGEITSRITKALDKNQDTSIKVVKALLSYISLVQFIARKWPYIRKSERDYIIYLSSLLKYSTQYYKDKQITD